MKNFQNEVESLNIGYLDVGKLLNGEIPIDTKCDLRFQKFEGFFRNCGGVLQNQNKSHKNIVCIAHSNFQFRKFHLDIYLVIIQPKMSKTIKNLIFCAKISQN